MHGEVIFFHESSQLPGTLNYFHPGTPIYMYDAQILFRLKTVQETNPGTPSLCGPRDTLYCIFRYYPTHPGTPFQLFLSVTQLLFCQKQMFCGLNSPKIWITISRHRERNVHSSLTSVTQEVHGWRCIGRYDFLAPTP